MNPQRTVPLLVVLSEKAVAKIAKRGVGQTSGPRFRVEEDAVVEVEPILPGCQCYPPKESVAIRPGTVSVRFWVVPHVLGQIMEARVLVRKDGNVLTEVPLQMRVVRQTMTWLVGGLSLLLPFVFLILKHFRLDFESQMQDGFGLYAMAAQWMLRSLSPEIVGGLLLAATGILYWWMRPKQRDVFWDVQLIDSSEETTAEDAIDEQKIVAERKPTEVQPMEPIGDPMDQLFARAKKHYEKKEYDRAIPLYEKGMTLGRAKPPIYHRASIAAAQSGNPLRGLTLLQEAQALNPPPKTRAVMFYNMACFACRLGRWDDAMGYLTQAVEGGYRETKKIWSDPDLEPLRWRGDFKVLMRSLDPAARR
jgi:hypothetical protein